MTSIILTVAMTLNLCTAPVQVAEQPQPTPTAITVSVGTEGATIDPAYLAESEPGDYLGHIYEGLMKYEPVSNESVMNEMTVTYGLAESVDVSEDGLTYRFTIRDNALWSDGVPVTAGHFAYAWQRLLASDSRGGSRMGAVVDTVTAEGDRVLLVTLQQPCPYFLKLCAQSYAAPVRWDLVETYGGDWTDEGHLAVTGAYTIRSWVHDDVMVLEKNPLYYAADTITAEEITWYFSDGSDTMDVDVAADTPQGSLVDGAGVYYLYLNANGIPDWRMRAAMTLALDREAIAAVVGHGAVAAEGLVPRGITDGVEGTPMIRWLQEMYTEYDLSTYEGRCDLARVLYGEVTGGGGRALRFRCNASAINHNVAALCCQSWEEVLGVTVTVQEMGNTAFEAMLRSNTFDVACLSWMADYDDPLNFLEIMERGGSYNYSAWGDVRYNDLLRACAVERENRRSLLYDTESALFEKERFAICPVFWYGENYTAAEGLTGIGHSPCGGYWFGNVSVLK